MSNLRYVTYQNQSFVGMGPGYTPPMPLPATPDAVTWWHTSFTSKAEETSIPVPGQVKYPQSIPGVTHLGDRYAAETRSDVNSLYGLHLDFAGLFEVQLPPGLKVFPDAFIESTGGQPAMKAFEQKLIDSSDDVAYTLNTKEGPSSGSWSIVIRRSTLGELHNKPVNAVVVKKVSWKPDNLTQDERMARLMRNS